jgi:hypothetical protein
MPSGPFKAEAFSELSRRARFRERRRKLRVWVFVLTLRLRKGAYSGARKFAGVLKRFDARMKVGEAYPFLKFFTRARVYASWLTKLVF